MNIPSQNDLHNIWNQLREADSQLGQNYSLPAPDWMTPEQVNEFNELLAYQGEGWEQKKEAYYAKWPNHRGFMTQLFGEGNE